MISVLPMRGFNTTILAESYPISKTTRPSMEPLTSPRINLSRLLKTVVDAELNEVIAAWPELPAAIKTGILAMVRAG